ncbi:regulatory protein, luxR family [Micromonospora nigra]|uniref:Regulatory protein, luxR family n=1 Tax=Micromonospora nigra TaxID=145857 RepID=A0A1C6RAN4_9ACTN|nr:LuxR family transcriptional regulator [Micromonospora nigra]SCL14060.1 regulatory protein, luxR family [Micromonospora nigra]
MTLSERDEHLDVLTGRLDDLLRPGGPATTAPITVVSGPVGVGKTTLLQAFVRRAAEAGVAVLSASASRAERTVPLEVVRQLVRTAPLTDATRDRVGRLIDRGALAWIEADDDEERCASVTAAIGGELLELAARGQLVVTVDDVHHADVPSLRCLDYAARRVAGLAVLIVLTESPRTRPWHPTAYAELMQPARLRRVRLPLLSPTGTYRILADRVGVPVARTIADEAHRISGGNPLLVRALADDHLAATGRTDRPVAGEAFREAVLSCLYRCDHLVLTTARALAVAEEPLHGPLIPHLVGLRPESNLRAVDPSTSAGLITGGGLRHPAVGQAVLDGMTTEERARLHRAAAILLHADSAPPTRIAPHLVGTDHLNEPWMAQTLLDAGEQLMLDGEVETARRFLRRANRDCADECLRARIRSALASAEWRVDPQAAVPHLVGVATAVRAGHLGSRQAAGPIQYLLWHGQVDRARELIRHLDDRADGVDPRSAAELLVTRGWMTTLYPAVAAYTDRGPLPVRDPLTLARVKRRLQGITMLGSVLERGDAAVVEDAERVLTTLRLDDEASIWTAVCVVVALIYADRLDLAEEWCHRLTDTAADRRHPTPSAVVRALAAAVAARRGDLPHARDLAEEALNRLTPKGWGVFIGIPLSVRLMALTGLHEWDDAAQCLRTAVPAALFETPFGLLYLHARGGYALASGNPDGALADFQLCGQLMTAWRLDLPALVPWRTEAARALLLMGRRQQAEKLIREQLELLRPMHARCRGAALRVLASTQEGPERIRHLRGAVRLLRQCGDRMELARALTDLGQAYQQAGDLRQARNASRAARTLAEQCSVPALRPAAPGPRDSSVEATDETMVLVTGLSDAESRVATLAAQGHTNREIAEKMFLTVSAIEQRLTRIYRKLDVHSRSELAARLRLTP